MFMRVVFIIIALTIFAISASAQDFSVDLTSPQVPIPYWSGDIIMSGGTPLKFPAGFLDPLLTLPSDEVTSISYGNDRIFDGVTKRLWFWFSVNRASVGVPAGVVNLQAAGNGAAGDIFWQTYFLGAPGLYKDALINGLIPLPPPPETDIDAVAVPVLPAEAKGAPFFTLDFPTAAKLGFGTADILYQPLPGPTPPPAILYAPAPALGLAPTDQIDGLAIKDKGVIGLLDPPDTVLVSLMTLDPTLVANGWSGADIIRVYPGPLAVVRAAADLGLLPTDEVDAISAYCCVGPGDINEDTKINVGDVVMLINWIFKSGPGPRCPDTWDTNGDCKINVADGIYHINYVFKGGPKPKCGCVY